MLKFLQPRKSSTLSKGISLNLFFLFIAFILLSLASLLPALEPAGVEIDEEAEYLLQQTIVPSIVTERRQWNVYPLDSLYLKPDELFPAILKLQHQYPHLVDWYIIGESSNHHLPIYALKITGITNSKPKPAVLLHGQHHSEEVLGVEIVFGIADHFLKNYGIDEHLTAMVNNYELWIVPTSNPEGFQVVNSGEFRLKRKNDTDSNLNGIREVSIDGVDLNRNYDVNWDEDIATNTESPYFKGYEPACQSETQAMQRFYAQRRFSLAVFYHSSATGAYSERIFFPWRWGEDDFSPDYREMTRLARTFAAQLPRNYREGNYQVHQGTTSRRGFARDYIYTRHNTLGMLVEVGGNSPYGEGVLTPPNEVLVKLKEQHNGAILHLLREHHRNLVAVQVTDLAGTPLRAKEIIIEGRESPRKEKITTCEQGYFFTYLLPREEPYNIITGAETFSFSKPKAGRRNIVLNVNEPAATPQQLTGINNGQAIVMTNPVFQYYPPLQAAGIRNQDTAYISLIKGMTISYRNNLNIRNESITIPWIPIDIVAKGVLSVHLRNVHPLQRTANSLNKIVFLRNERETLSYCIEMSQFNPFYLHSGVSVGIDYALYPAGDNDFLLTGIKVYGEPGFPGQQLEAVLYAGATPLGKYKLKHSTNDDSPAFNALISPAINFPGNLYLIIKNSSSEPALLHRERRGAVPANRQTVFYSKANPLPGSDLAVAITLEKQQRK